MSTWAMLPIPRHLKDTSDRRQFRAEIPEAAAVADLQNISLMNSHFFAEIFDVPNQQLQIGIATSSDNEMLGTTPAAATKLKGK